MIKFFTNKEQNLPDFFNVILQCIFSNEITQKSNFKISFDIFYKILFFVIEALENNIVFNKNLSQNHYLALINSLNYFSKNFNTLISSTYKNRLDNRFVDKLIQSKFYQDIKGVFRIVYNELEKTIEKKIQKLFYEQKDFFQIDLKQFFSSSMRNNFLIIKTSLLVYFSENMFNNVLNFLIEYYFSKIFITIVKLERRNDLIQKIKNDKILIQSIFCQLINESNLSILLNTFDNFLILIMEKNHDTILQALIKLNVFFNNRLSTDILVSIFIKNFNIPFDVEEDIIDFFNQCNYLNQQKNMLESNFDGCQSKSKILFNSTRAQKKISNYLPHLSFNSMLKLKEISFMNRIKILKQEKENSMNFSFECDLVNFNTHEKYLENIVKVIIFQSEEFSKLSYSQKMQKQKYEKYQCKVEQNNLTLINLDNYEQIFKANIKYLLNIKTLNDLVISFVSQLELLQQINFDCSTNKN